MTDSRLELPGPRRFVEDLAAALSGSSQLVVLVPSGFDTASLRRAVRDRSPALMWITGDVRDLDDRPPLDAVTSWLDVPLPVTRVHDERDLAKAAELADHLVWLDGYQQLPTARRAEWRAFLERYASAARREGDHRPPLLCLTIVAPEPADVRFNDPAIQVAYWWGRLSRLDLAIYLDSADPDMSPLDRAVAVEVAGFDLDLADRLADAERLDIEAVEALVGDFSAERCMASLEAESHGCPCRPSDPGASLGPWAAGQVDRFDYSDRLFEHSAACGPDIRRSVLRRRVWRGQITTLLPELEIWRTELIACARVRGYIADGIATDTLDFRELHEHLKAERHDAIRRQMAELAGELRWARNRIAHLDLLTADTVHKLHRDAARLLDRVGASRQRST